MGRILRLFALSGRAGREEYWDVAVGSALVWAVLTFLAARGPPYLLVLSTVGVLVLLYLTLAVGVRRLHDRGKSGWWILIFGVAPWALALLAAMVDRKLGGQHVAMTHLPALLLSIWAWMELGYLPAGQGAERYGRPETATPLATVF